MAYPLFVAFLSLIFAWQVAQDYTARKRPYQALWATALVMTTIASMGYLAASQNQVPWAFRIYYIFGALLVPPYMGMGSLFLVVRESIARKILWGVHVLGLVGAVLILGAPMDIDALATLSGGSGRGILASGPWLPFVIFLNFFGTLCVSGVALYSAIRSIVSRQDGRFALANLTIGVGFLLLAVAGSVARWVPDWDGAFWLVMAMGWLIAFVGFRIVTLAAEARRAQATQSANAR